MNLVAIDFETANRYRNSPCAIGIVVFNEKGIVDEFYSLINPLTEFESHNVFVHGITELDVINAPTFNEIWQTIKEYIANNLLVAHNASFDMSVLRATLDRFHLPYPDLEYLCSVMISKQVWPGLSNYKLNTLAEMKDIKFSHHQALDDARVVVYLLIEAIKEQQVEDINELINTFNISCGRIFEKGYVTPKVKRRKTKQKIKGDIF